MQGDIQHIILNGSDILSYVPRYARDNEHYVAIANSVNILLNKLVNSMQLLENNQNVDTFNLVYIKLYEDLYGLVVLEGDTLEDRRERIKARLKSVPPFTEPFLKEQLDRVLGKDNYNLEVISETFSLKLSYDYLDIKKQNELISMVHLIKPANLVFTENPVIKRFNRDLGTVIEGGIVSWNYTLDDLWKLSQEPFGTVKYQVLKEGEGYKIMTREFIERGLLARMGLVHKVVLELNDRIELTYNKDEIDTKLMAGMSEPVGILDVVVDDEDIGGAYINKIEMFAEDGVLLSSYDIPKELQITVDTKDVGFILTHYFTDRERGV